jgi:hypothetical protein
MISKMMRVLWSCFDDGISRARLALAGHPKRDERTFGILTRGKTDGRDTRSRIKLVPRDEPFSILIISLTSFTPGLALVI